MVRGYEVIISGIFIFQHHKLFGIIIKVDNIPHSPFPIYTNALLSIISHSGTSKHFLHNILSPLFAFYTPRLSHTPPIHSIPFQSHLQSPEMLTHVSNPILPIHARSRSFHFVTSCTPQLPCWAYRACLFQTDKFLQFIARSVVRLTTQPHVHPSIV